MFCGAETSTDHSGGFLMRNLMQPTYSAVWVLLRLQGIWTLLITSFLLSGCARGKLVKEALMVVLRNYLMSVILGGSIPLSA